MPDVLTPLRRPMSPPALPARAAVEATHYRNGRRRSVIVFATTFLFYAVIGLKVVVFQHVVVPDGWARLAHAYFAFYNAPAKLAAIGFIWPPIGTLVLLPLAW